MSEQSHNGVLVSACLLGRRVRYDGGHSAAESDVFDRWRRQDRLVAFCPEVAGGLPTPRPPAEIVGGDGDQVLDGTARVISNEGVDVTDAFLRGAHTALEAALKGNAKLAVLKSKSPSCGSKHIYDGSFSGVRRDGNGVTAALLVRNGIRVFNEHELTEADAYLGRLESQQSERGARP